MKRILISLLLFFTLSNICYAQNNWTSGYILRQPGDTTYGFIDNRDSKSNSKLCYFKKEVNGEIQTYTPQELFGYRFKDSKFYISKNIAGEEPVFLEFLIHGKINIYHLKDNNNRYFVEKDSVLYELKNTEVEKHVYYSDTLNANYYSIRFVERKEYIGILSTLLKDAEIQQDIVNSKLETKSLIKIAKEYHQKVCSGEKCIVYEKNIKPMLVNIGIHAGVSMNTINFGDEVVSDLGLGSLLGLRFELENALEWQENLSVVLDLTLQRFTNYTLRANDVNISHPLKYDNVDYTLINSTEFSMIDKNSLNVNINAMALKIPLTINYTFSKAKVRPYVGTGIENTLILSQNKDFIYTKFQDIYHKSIPTYQVGIVERAGSKYMLKNNHFLYAEFNYELNQNLNMNQFLRFTDNLFSISVGYGF